MTTKKTIKPDTSLSFEAAMQRLEAITTELEAGNVPLDEALGQFEEGMQLAKICEDKLNTLSGRVEKIMADFSTQTITVPPAILPTTDNDEDHSHEF